MTAKEIANALSEMEGRFKSFTATDKALLLDIATAEGLQFNTHCPDCWRDIYLTLRNRHMKPKKQGQGKYEFLGHRTLYWRGIAINGDTPVKVIEEFMANDPLNRNFFKKIEKPKKDEK